MTSKAYATRIAESKGRLDEAIRSDAKRFGHHGAEDFVTIIRQRHNAAITLEYAHELCDPYVFSGRNTRGPGHYGPNG